MQESESVPLERKQAGVHRLSCDLLSQVPNNLGFFSFTNAASPALDSYFSFGEMSFKTERRFKMKTGKWSIQKLIYTAMLAAVAGVLMSLEFSVPMMPPFYKVDFSDVPSVIAVFLMGPVSGICVEVIKLLIKLITVGTNTMYVGELANLIAAFLFVWPLWFLYQKLGANRKAAVEALLLSIVIRTACACFINANITLPLYAKAMSLPLDEVIRMVASVNPAVKDLNGFIILATIPFNVLKVGLNYIVGQLLFVRLRAAKIVPKAV